MNRTTIARSIAAALLGSAVLVTAVPALSQPQGEGHRRGHTMQMTEADRAQMRDRMQARVNERLDGLAARLEIKASQQDAWEAYKKARTSMFQTRPERPARDADAATRAKFRADMAQRRAQYLATMADATAQLQNVLEPQQRKVLDEIARHTGARAGQGGHRHGGHRHGGHGGGERRGSGGRA
jgi:hypothetical protein